MIVAAVPVKRLADAKSRLASLLAAAERVSLVLSLLDRTVSALQDSGHVDRVAVATPEEELALRLAVAWLPDRGNLNATLEGAAQWAQDGRAGALLIVPGDLPLLTPADVRNFVRSASERPGIGIAPTHDGGTGGLLLAPPQVMPPAFGPNSFQRHLELARQRRLPVHRISAEAFAFDLDTAEDYERLAFSLHPAISAGE